MLVAIFSLLIVVVVLAGLGWFIAMCWAMFAPETKKSRARLAEQTEAYRAAAITQRERTDAAEVERQVEIALAVKARLAAE